MFLSWEPQVVNVRDNPLEEDEMLEFTLWENFIKRG